MQQTQENPYFRVLAGWISLLLVLTASSLIVVANALVANDGIKGFLNDPGADGLAMMRYVFAIYAVMPVLVSVLQRFDSRLPRWALLGFTILLFVFFVLHHMQHWQEGERADFNANVLDLAHHAVALWLIYSTFIWARKPAVLAAA